MEHLSNDHKNHPNNHKNSHEIYNKTRHPVLSLMESQWKLRQQHDQNFQWRERHCRTNTSARRQKQIQNSRTVKVPVRDWSSKVNHLSRSFKKNYNTVHQVYQFDKSRLASHLMDIKVTNTLADGLIGRTSSMLDEIESKNMHKDKEGD